MCNQLLEDVKEMNRHFIFMIIIILALSGCLPRDEQNKNLDSFYAIIELNNAYQDSIKLVVTGEDVFCSTNRGCYYQVGDSLSMQIYSEKDNIGLTIINFHTKKIVYSDPLSFSGLTKKKIKISRKMAPKERHNVLEVKITNGWHTISYLLVVD